MPRTGSIISVSSSCSSSLRSESSESDQSVVESTKSSIITSELIYHREIYTSTNMLADENADRKIEELTMGSAAEQYARSGGAASCAEVRRGCGGRRGTL